MIKWLFPSPPVLPGLFSLGFLLFSFFFLFIVVLGFNFFDLIKPSHVASFRPLEKYFEKDLWSCEPPQVFLRGIPFLFLFQFAAATGAFR